MKRVKKKCVTKSAVKKSVKRNRKLNHKKVVKELNDFAVVAARVYLNAINQKPTKAYWKVGV